MSSKNVFGFSFKNASEGPSECKPCIAKATWSLSMYYLSFWNLTLDYSSYYKSFWFGLLLQELNAFPRPCSPEIIRTTPPPPWVEHVHVIYAAGKYSWKQKTASIQALFLDLGRQDNFVDKPYFSQYMKHYILRMLWPLHWPLQGTPTCYLLQPPRVMSCLSSEISGHVANLSKVPR